MNADVGDRHDERRFDVDDPHREDGLTVGVVVQSDFPTDRQVRPRKIAKAVDSDGETCLVYACENQQERTADDCSYTDVRRFDYFSGRSILDWLHSSFPFNPVWILWLVFSFRRDEVDVVIGGDVRAGLPTAVAATLLGLPAILDLQENNPERQGLLPVESPAHLITRNGRLIRWVEHLCIDLSDEVWVMVEERREDLVLQGIAEGKITVVRNTPLLAEMEPPEPRNSSGTNDTGKTNRTDDTNDSEETLTLVYLGVINELRGLDGIIEALPEIRDEAVSAKVIIRGDGDYRPELERRVDELGLQESVTFVERLELDEIPSFLASGDIGLELKEVNRHHNTTIPNKVFDYMALELPILLSNLRPSRRIVREENCGHVLPTHANPEQIARAVEHMSELDLQQMGENGRNAVLERYNWEQEWQKAAASIVRVSGRNRV
jgi:glycosyltransferase involved in cell wall biosynthesis